MAGESILSIARAVLEAQTPLSVTTGQPDNVFDTALVRDANGLPALPGTALAGVLRHLWQASCGEASAQALFGHQTEKEGVRSRVAVSWGCMLDSAGRALQGLALGGDAARLRDPLYAQALAQVDAPVFRNRVRLTHRGAAADTGKFDRAVLPAGNRFAVELRLWTTDDHADAEADRLFGLLRHPGLRLGGATRAGLGRLCCVRLHAVRIDLRKPGAAQRLREIGHDPAQVQDMAPFTAAAATTAGWITGTLRLTARGLWRIGQGVEPLLRTDKPADLLPLVEPRVLWPTGESGKLGPSMLLVPASSVKGALAHRMAFHARRFEGEWCIAPGTDDDRRPEAVDAVFGSIKDKAQSENDASGRAGCLYLDDAFIPVDERSIARLMHNAIDRFTAGVRDRVLYEEESVVKGSVEIPMAIDARHLVAMPHAREALRLTLRDLCAGRLALGSRTTTGNGFFEGCIDGELGAWLNSDAAGSKEAA